MSDESEHTCGKGIAVNAVLPERMAALLSAMASIYENHVRSLGDGANSRAEIDAYKRLERDYRAAATSVTGLADAMRSYRDLPMADHDYAVLMDARSVAAMETLVVAQEELQALIAQRASEFREMFEAMKKS